VDWYPWTPEAFARARAENKPVLLSIGYAACHWCHVMEHESFEDDETAKLMNERFVSIKVDREERPDIDGIYMQAVQAMTGHGGWPMTVFLTPEGLPFFSGTYFPPEDRHGMPSFRRVLVAVSDAYRERPADVARTASQVREIYAAATRPAESSGFLNEILLERAFRGLAQQFDERHGGFGGAPKFPSTMALEFVLQHWGRTRTAHALEMVTKSFRAMARGGIYDQVGGGFARYSVDATWLVPHFEKMLYDNALLARLGVHLWQATKDEEFRRVTRETLDWATREMSSPEGGFYSSLDADSEGEEGKFYLWSLGEIGALLGEDAPLVEAYWDVTQGGNFEGHNILHVPHEPGVVAARNGVTVDHLQAVIARARATLYQARAARIHPGRDEKVLASWNALMVRAFAEAARAFDDAGYRARGVRGGEFLFSSLVRDGRVLRSYKDGIAKIPGYLEDHAALGLAALSLYELTFDREWLDRARQMAEAVHEWFWDEELGAFFDTARDHETLVSRPRDATDNATPAGSSLACDLYARLAELRNDVELRRRATFVLESLAEFMARHPTAFGHTLGVADFLVRGAVELAIVGEPESEGFRGLARAAASRYVPALVIAGGDVADIALLSDRPMRDGRATAYVCRNYTCDEPVVEASALIAQLEKI
jgi:hypothetical protein